MPTAPRTHLSLATIALLGLLYSAVPGDARVVWVRRAPIPTPRATLAACELDGRIYAIGGGGYIVPTAAAVEAYDPATDTWTRKADLPTARGYLAAAAVGGRIFAIGGFGPTAGDYGVRTRVVEMYDPATDIWTRKADLPIPVSALSASVVRGKIYAIGGSGTDWAALNNVLEYDPDSDTWTRKANMPTSRFKLATCVLGGKIYAIGGRTVFQLYDKVEVYDPTTDTWSTEAPMPTPRCGLGAEAIDGRIYAIGGGFIDNSVDTDGVLIPGPVEVFDPVARAWTRETYLPEPKGWLAAATVSGSTYAVGGAIFFDAAMQYSSVTEELLLDHPELVASVTGPQSVAAGRGLQLSLEVELTGPSQDGTYPPVHLDLSDLGVAGAVPFVHEGQGRYSARPILDLSANGRFELPVRMAQPDPLVLCSIPLTVMPASDLSLFGDRPGVGWSWRAEGKASVDTASTAAAFQGTGSLAVQASGPWKVFCETARPVDRLGYVSLNLAVLPGETAPTAIEVGLNLNKRRSIAKLVNWADRSWQQVSLPLDSLGLGPYESIASILLYGGPKGSFSVDDVKLVALPPPAPPTAVLEAWTGAVPGAFALLQNYPNPFNSGTVIAYNLPAPDEVALTVHNLVGQQVAILTQGARQAGAHVLTWDGRDGNGRPLASGIYVYRLQTKAQQQTRKLLLLR